MRFGHRPLVNPGTPASEVDIGDSQEHRRWVHEQVRLRAHLLQLLSSTAIDRDAVWVTPYGVSEDGRDGSEIVP